MHFGLKVGSIVEYQSSTKSLCVAKIVRVGEHGFTFKVFKVNDKPWNEEIYCDYSGWEINRFRVRLHLI